MCLVVGNEAVFSVLLIYEAQALIGRSRHFIISINFHYLDVVLELDVENHNILPLFDKHKGE